MKKQFIEALHKNSALDLQKIAKSDLHNHAGRGGNIRYIEAWTNVEIEPSIKPFDSLFKMQRINYIKYNISYVSMHHL